MASERIPLLGSTPLLAPRILFKTGAAFAAAGIIAGAFGTHGLKKRAGTDADADKVHAWQTAAHYSMFNGLALMVVSMHPQFSLHRFAGPAIAAGGFLFSSDIIALVLNRERFKVLGPFAPMGGAIMIAGYLSLLF